MLFVMFRSNRTVSANLALTQRQTRRYSVILYTDDCSSFILKNFLHELAWKMIKPGNAPIKRRDSNDRSINTVSVINLVVEIWQNSTDGELQGRQTSGRHIHVSLRLLRQTCRGHQCMKRMVRQSDRTSVPICPTPPPPLTGSTTLLD